MVINNILGAFVAHDRLRGSGRSILKRYARNCVINNTFKTQLARIWCTYCLFIHFHYRPHSHGLVLKSWFYFFSIRCQCFSIRTSLRFYFFLNWWISKGLACITFQSSKPTKTSKLLCNTKTSTNFLVWIFRTCRSITIIKGCVCNNLSFTSLSWINISIDHLVIFRQKYTLHFKIMSSSVENKHMHKCSTKLQNTQIFIAFFRRIV